MLKKFDEDKNSLIEREKRVSELETKLNEKDSRLDTEFIELEKLEELAHS